MAEYSALVHEHTRLLSSTFLDVDLSGSVFDDVNLQGAAFENVALRVARLRNVDLSQVTIDDAKVEGMRIHGVAVSELFRAYVASRK